MIGAATVLGLLGYVTFAYSTNTGLRGKFFNKIPSDDRFNYFDAELIQEATKRHDGNVLISPVSMKAALLMVLEGAVGKSADEIKDVLRLPDEKELYRMKTQQFLRRLAVKSPSITIETGNSLFLSNDLKPYSEYRAAMQEYYSATISEVDFTSPTKAAMTINDWVSGVTHGLIPKLVEAEGLPTDTKLMMTNAVYFKGKWKIAFDADGTTVRCFYKQNLECQRSYFMETLSYFKYGYISSLDAEAVEILYYDDQYSMVILLPTKRNSINKLIRDLTHTPLSEAIGKLQLTEILLSIPRFNITYNSELIPVLERLGVQEVFGAHANLSGIARNIGTAHISQILHATKIEVNEEGTIAGAGTGVLVVPLMGTTIPRFRADSPFLFFIRDTVAGTILFGGLVSTPEAANMQLSEETFVSELKVELDTRKEETTEHYISQVSRGHTKHLVARPTNLPTDGRPVYQQPQSNDKDAIQFSFSGNL
ncbi:leukocyte elastase inhibitor-like [Schistocerca serialis cubense]|uniref:leukocyte elastase inhibitor-like n=1 Tax=Schistocerca serialis cubense TaxID=2023355 RepID=UPI00214ECD12|nr:leukocyte elastase inhibitor-like [Schistocerca serialis cubense]